MRIKDLATRVANLFSGNAYFVVDNGTKVEKVTSATLAQQTLETYSGSTLAGTAQSVKAAIDGLNTNWGQLSGTANITVSSLDNVPCPGMGYISFSDASISPEGSTTAFYAYECFGRSNTTRRTLICTNVNQNTVFINTCGSDGWTGWKTIVPEVYPGGFNTVYKGSLAASGTGASVTITGAGTHCIYIVAVGNWNASRILVVYPGNGGDVRVKPLSWYANSDTAPTDIVTITAGSGTSGITIANASSNACPLTVFAIVKSN